MDIYVVLSAAALWFPSTHAFGYIDPGLGSYVIQSIIAGILGSFFVIKMYYHRVKSKINRIRGKE